MSQSINNYRKSYSELPLDAVHCGNCTHLNMCLGLRYSQPISSPDNARKQCDFFQLWPLCVHCGQRKSEVGKDYTGYMCLNKECAGRKENE